MGKQLNVENSVISAKDDALFYNAMLQKNGVWQYGNKLDYEIISANQIIIKDGMVTAQGRNYVIYPNEVDSLTIENGTVNTKRNDLLVYEVSKTSEGEQVGLKVIKGTNATTPTDPTLTQDDTLASGSKYQMPLYRVRLNGINIEGVDDLREYIVSFGNLSNDNLLINSDFRNPVNQRGQMSYWKHSSWTYSIDRWTHIYNSVILEEGYIRIYNDSGETGTTYFKQIFENAFEQNDYTVTVNVKEINGTVQVEGFGTLVKGLNVFTKNTSLPQLQLNLVGESSVELYYIKLEQGSIATPLVPVDFQKELEICKKYYMKIRDWESSYPFRGDNNAVYVFLSGIQMRTNPTVTGGRIQFMGLDVDGSTVAPQLSSDVLSAYSRNDGVEIHYIKANTVVNFGIAVFELTMELDAEIY